MNHQAMKIKKLFDILLISHCLTIKLQNTIQIQIIWYSINMQKHIATKLKAETLRNIVDLIDKLFLNNTNPKQHRACKDI